MLFLLVLGKLVVLVVLVVLGVLVVLVLGIFDKGKLFFFRIIMAPPRPSLLGLC